MLCQKSCIESHRYRREALKITTSIISAFIAYARRCNPFFLPQSFSIMAKNGQKCQFVGTLFFLALRQSRTIERNIQEADNWNGMWQWIAQGRAHILIGALYLISFPTHIHTFYYITSGLQHRDLHWVWCSDWVSSFISLGQQLSFERRKNNNAILSDHLLPNSIDDFYHSVYL